MTVAVLLIIGASVIGPIDAQPTSPCIPFIGCRGYETISEVCVRALKEIGADDRYLAVTDKGGTGMVDQMPVRCISAPNGLKR